MQILGLASLARRTTDCLIARKRAAQLWWPLTASAERVTAIVDEGVGDVALSDRRLARARSRNRTDPEGQGRQGSVAATSVAVCLWGMR